MAVPVVAKMPAPMVAPTPSAVRCHLPRVRRSPPREARSSSQSWTDLRRKSWFIASYFEGRVKVIRVQARHGHIFSVARGLEAVGHGALGEPARVLAVPDFRIGVHPRHPAIGLDMEDHLERDAPQLLRRPVHREVAVAPLRLAARPPSATAPGAGAAPGPGAGAHAAAGPPTAPTAAAGPDARRPRRLRSPARCPPPARPPLESAARWLALGSVARLRVARLRAAGRSAAVPAPAQRLAATAGAKYTGASGPRHPRRRRHHRAGATGFRPPASG